MTIELHCDGCGKLLKAPDSAGGKRSRCPACDHEVYIPSANTSELEELPLAPEDEQAEQEAERLQRERRELEKHLREESPEGVPLEETGAPGDASEIPAGSETGVEKAIISYLQAMRDSNFDQAESALGVLKRQPNSARDAIDRFARQEKPPSALGNVPPGVFQGFLKNLRQQL